jgi:hypothetical protein
MADTFTTNLNLTKPQIGGDTDAWGTLLNADFDTIDAIFAGAGTGTSVGLNVGTGKTLAVAGTANITGGGSLGGTFTGTPTFSGLITLSGGGALSGTFTGAPTFSGNVAFTGTPNFSNSHAIGTLSSWGGGKAFQVGSWSSLWTDTTATTAISSNAYWNGTSWVYNTTGIANQYYQATQSHFWRSAVSGGAGTNITAWVQQMSLDASGNLAAAGTATFNGTGNSYFGGNLGIGNTSPAYRLDVRGGDFILSRSAAGTAGDAAINFGNNTNNYIYSGNSSNLMAFATNGSERMRIDSSGNLLVGTTSQLSTARTTIVGSSTNVGLGVQVGNAAFGSLWTNTSGTSNYYPAVFYNNGTSLSLCGSIAVSGTLTAYNVTSDYRLKENIVPLTGALDKISQLKPSLYNYKADPSTQIEGFIAHELQAVVPHAVTGVKDGTREEQYEVTPAVLDDKGLVVTPAVMGTRTVPDYQGVDSSFLIPHLVAAIQELNAKVTAQAADIAALKAKVGI